MAPRDQAVIGRVCPMIPDERADVAAHQQLATTQLGGVDRDGEADA